MCAVKLVAFVLALGLGVLVACSNPASEPPNPPPTQPDTPQPEPPQPDPPPPETPVTATIPPEGGSLMATAQDGSSLSLNFPAGSVLEPLEVTLTPSEPGEARARYLLEPYGVRLAVPVEISLTLPEGLVLEGGALTFDDGSYRVPLDSTLDLSTRTVTALSSDLGYTLDALAEQHVSPQNSAPGAIDFSDVNCTLSLQTLSALRAQAGTYYTRYDPELPEFGQTGFITTSLLRAIERAYLQAERDCQEAGEEALFQQEREFIQELACDGYRSARTTATLTATSFLLVCHNPREPWVCDDFDAAGALDDSFSASFVLAPASDVSVATTSP